MPAAVIIACSIFKRELYELQGRHPEWPPIHYLDSMLHMEPLKLRDLLDEAIRHYRSVGCKIGVVYGECHPWIEGPGRDIGVQRVPGMNCIEIILGREDYRRLHGEGAFFLMPEWLGRWQEIFRHELGLNQDSAHGLMGQMHKRLIYIDTGLQDIPRQQMDELSQFTGLPWQTITTDLGNLESAVQATLRSLESIA